MAEAVVEHLESVEIDEQDGGGVAVALEAGDGQLELAQETATVGTGDERVAMRQPVELGAAPVELGAAPLELGDARVELGQLARAVLVSQHLMHPVGSLPHG